MTITDQNQTYIWHNGFFIPKSEAEIPILTHGLHYGSSLFEGCRIYNGMTFKLEEHIKRLLKGMEVMMMGAPYSLEELVRITEELVVKNNIKEGYIRHIAFRGSDKLIVGHKSKVEVAIAAWNMPEVIKLNLSEKKKLTLKLASFRKIPANCGPVENKLGGYYVTNSLEKYKAIDEGFDDALFLDINDFVAEASTSNIFFVQGNKIITPSLGCFLNGITRQTFIELAKNNALEVIEKNIKLEELSTFDECFLTGTALEMSPVEKIDKYEFNKIEISSILYQKFIELIGK